MSQLKTHIINRNDTEARWKEKSSELVDEYIPKQGEFLIYNPDELHQTARVKVGDGKTPVNDLPYIQAGYADMLSQAVIIRVSGAINGSLTFDASKDITINTALTKLGAHSHNLNLTAEATFNYLKPKTISAQYTPNGTTTGVRSITVSKSESNILTGISSSDITFPEFDIKHFENTGALEISLTSGAYTAPTPIYGEVAFVSDVTAQVENMPLVGTSATIKSAVIEEELGASEGHVVITGATQSSNIGDIEFEFTTQETLKSI